MFSKLFGKKKIKDNSVYPDTYGTEGTMWILDIVGYSGERRCFHYKNGNKTLCGLSTKEMYRICRTKATCEECLRIAK